MSAAAFPFEPNFIDWRASRGRADRRANADDPTLEICAHCETEIDVAQPAHRPNCAGIGAPRASSATVVSLPPPEKKVPIKHHHSSDARCRVPGCKWQARQDQPDGLELLERMDAGLPLGEVDEPEPELEEVPEESIGADGTGTSSSAGVEPELDEAAAVGDFAESGTAGGSSSEPERAAATSTSTHGNKHVSPASDLWPRERMIAAVTAYADKHGQLPMQRDWMGPSTGDHPNVALVNKMFGNWGNLIVEAGFPRPRRGGKPLVVGEPRVAPATAPERPKATPAGWIKVNGTGLAYRNPTDAYAAAEEIEADGERVALAARDAGDEAKADKAIDAARALADKIRGAARAADERAEEPQPQPAPSPGGAEPEPVTPAPARSADPPPDLRAFALAAIAAARTFADALERELAAS